MSFWPFTNPYGASSHLQKFLDSAQEPSTVTAQGLLENKELSSELVDELKTISSKSLRGNNLSFAQSLSNEAQNRTQNNTDSASVTSSNTDGGAAGTSKNSREQKVIEILVQPHVLDGLLDYIVDSVDFFHEVVNGEIGAEGGGRENADADMSDSGENAPPETASSGNNVNLDTNSDSGSETLDGSAGSRASADPGETEESEPHIEKVQRCISTAAEILSTDLWVISNRIIETPALMGKLWSVLSHPRLKEQSPALAYLVQILGHLMDSNCIEMINFVRKQQRLVDTFLNKIDIPILMDFFLKIIQTDKPDSPTGILAVLSRQQLVPKLIGILTPEGGQGEAGEHDGSGSKPAKGSLDPDFLFRQTSTTEFIKALVTISSNPSLAVDLDSNIGPNELTRELASSKVVDTMLRKIMLAEVDMGSGPVPNKYGISNCVSILIELIRKNNSDYDSNCGSYTQSTQGEGSGEINVHTMYLWLKDVDLNPPGTRDPIYLGELLRIFSDGLPDLVSLVNNSGPKDSKTLGLTKFKIAELIAELLHCSNMILLNSNKIAYLVTIRDELRDLQAGNIEVAMAETLRDSEDTPRLNSPFVSHLTSAMDSISLECPPNTEESASNSASSLDSALSTEKVSEIDTRHRENLANITFEDDEDEEPTVSNENPFVCDERDKSFRDKPCAGDYFKIKLIDSEMLYTIVSQFTEYPWHNFLHNVVFDLIQQIFNGKLNSYNSFLIEELFRSCDITNMIADAFKDVSDPRPGYMGHLVLVSEEIVKFASLYKPSLISSLIVEALGSSSWEWFISEVLLKTRELYNVVLGTDPDYDQDRDDEGKFGFDSATVGFMDVDSEDAFNHSAIILGDSSNHDEFVNERTGPESDDEEDEVVYADDFEVEDDVLEDVEHGGEISERKILDVPIKSMSPNVEFENNDMLYEDIHGSKVAFGEDMDDFPGSSSSDEDEEEENQLYRVAKHSS